MLNYFNANKKSSLKKLELILSKRKLKQSSQSSKVKSLNVKKKGIHCNKL